MPTLMFKRVILTLIRTLQLAITDITNNKNIALRLTLKNNIPCFLFNAEMKIINKSKAEILPCEKSRI